MLQTLALPVLCKPPGRPLLAIAVTVGCVGATAWSPGRQLQLAQCLLLIIVSTTSAGQTTRARQQSGATPSNNQEILQKKSGMVWFIFICPKAKMVSLEDTLLPFPSSFGSLCKFDCRAGWLQLQGIDSQQSVAALIRDR